MQELRAKVTAHAGRAAKGALQADRNPNLRAFQESKPFKRIFCYFVPTTYNNELALLSISM